MVKFGQKLRDNSVVEWHEEGAYVDYKGLKKLIKKLSAEQELAASNGMSRRPSFLGVFTSTPGGTRSLNGGGGGADLYRCEPAARQREGERGRVGQLLRELEVGSGAPGALHLTTLELGSRAPS